MLLGPTAPFPETALRPCFLSVSESVSPTRDISALRTIRLSALAKAARGLLQLALVAFVSHRLAAVGSGALLRPRPFLLRQELGELCPSLHVSVGLSDFRTGVLPSSAVRFSLYFRFTLFPCPGAGPTALLRKPPRFPSVSDSASPLRHRLRTSRHWEKKTECTCYGATAATGSVQLVLVGFRETD